MEERSMIDLHGIVKRFYVGKANELEILHGIDLNVRQGEFVSIEGASGSGKSTLMNIIGVLDRPTEGSYILDGVDVAKARDNELSDLRNRKIGFVFQTYNLIGRTSALKNVELPMLYGKMDRKKRRELAKELLEMVGMSSKKRSRLNMLSGGEQQRIAIAIALANSPKLLLADEPTGSVDPRTANYIFDVFTELNRQGQTILIVTHDVALSKKVKRVVAIRDGKISSERILKEKYADRIREAAIDWRAEDTQEEYAIVDRAGRVQIPRDILSSMNLQDNKVKLELSEGKVIISSPSDNTDNQR